MIHPKNLQRLIDAFQKLPGVGPKMAERLSYHILLNSASEADELIEAIQEIKSSLRLCSECYSPTEKDLCSICNDNSRDKSVICIVKNTSSLNAIEQTKRFNGLYHILDKIISPLDGTFPEKERIKKLIQRLDNGVKEVIIATDTDTEGEMTSNYLAELIKEKHVKVSRLGYGMPLGGTIEYADEITLSRSLDGRKEI
ncbi:MAG: recombination protein RecR [Elusimicrobia bacterium RIFOXYA2_FULL_40_6]|nr:MAG: recombination protein RecR [Elusimicrobia bacterium RIFOXYA2_FULL_40_6]